MRWYKRDSNESEKPHVVDLFQRHGWRGYFFWTHLNDMLARYFNFWCPGSYKFKTSIFYAFFYPHIKDRRTIRKMMDYLNDEGIIFSHITGYDIYICYSGMEEKAREYIRKRLSIAKEKGLEQPELHQELHFMCTQMLPSFANAIPALARRCAEDKEFRSKLFRTKDRTSFPENASILLETNNYLKTKGEDREEEEREGISFLAGDVKEEQIESKTKEVNKKVKTVSHNGYSVKSKPKKPKVNASESAWKKTLDKLSAGDPLENMKAQRDKVKSEYEGLKKANPGKTYKEHEEAIEWWNIQIAGYKKPKAAGPAA